MPGGAPDRAAPSEIFALELRRLHYFVTTAEELNLHTAAERLGVTQPAVTGQISALEQELGLDLFVREKQRVVALTSAGDSYLEFARRALFEMENARRNAREAAAGKSGPVRFGICEEVATGNGLRLLTEARRTLPDTAFEVIELHPQQLPSAVLRSEIDACLVLLPCEAPGLQIAPLWRETWVAALAKDHPLGDRASLRCQDLADEDLILGHSHLGVGGHDLIRSAFSRAGLTPKVAVQALRRSTMLTLAAASVGVTFMPSFLKTLNLPEFSMVPLEDETMTIAIGFRDGGLSPAVQEFIDLALASSEL